MSNILRIQSEKILALYLERTTHICQGLEVFHSSYCVQSVHDGCMVGSVPYLLRDQTSDFTHLLSAAGFRVTSIAPPSALMTVFSCS